MGITGPRFPECSEPAPFPEAGDPPFRACRLLPPFTGDVEAASCLGGVPVNWWLPPFPRFPLFTPFAAADGDVPV